MFFSSSRISSLLFALALLPLGCSSTPSSTTNTGGAGGAGGTDGTGGIPNSSSSGLGGAITSSSSSGGCATGSSGSIPALPCDDGFGFSSNPITTPTFEVTYKNAIGYAYVDVEVTGPGAPASEWGGVVDAGGNGAGPFTWTHTVYGYDVGTLTLKFVEGKTNGSPGNVVAQCQVNTLVKGSPSIGGSSSSSSGGGLATCAQLAQANGWPGGTFTCDDGSKGWCAGTGTPTSDCASCCGPSCGILADYYNTTANCDNGNGACNGSGIPTWDCNAGCCGPGIPNSQPTGGAKFGYPVGDKSTSPAGGAGWSVWQVLGHYWSMFNGTHLAHDVGKAGAANAPVFSVGDGVVLVSAPNSSAYKNVILIQHTMGDGSKVCSFYGHLGSRLVSGGQTVTRGQQIATVLDDGGNSHLHYFIAPKATCDKIVSNGGGACGYDGSMGVPGLGHTDLANEPASYVAKGTNVNGCSLDGYTIWAPDNFIDANHF